MRNTVDFSTGYWRSGELNGDLADDGDYAVDWDWSFLSDSDPPLQLCNCSNPGARRCVHLQLAYWNRAMVPAHMKKNKCHCKCHD